MGAALRWAEAEDWLGGAPFSLADGPAISAGNQLPGRHREPASQPAPAAAAVRGEADNRLLADRKRARNYLLVGMFSVVAHVSLALCVAALLPGPIKAEQAERGGVVDAADMLLVGIEESAALIEGAKAEPASLTMPPIIETPPDIQPASTEMPASAFELPAVPPVVAPPEPSPAPLLLPMIAPPADLSPALAAPIPPRITPRTQEALPHQVLPRQVLPRQVLPRPDRKQAERKTETRRPPTARANPDARGRQGEGAAVASRPADVRGGTGGRAPTAGTAAMTSFRSRIVAHLTRHKSYPEQAQDRGIGGRNAVSLTISRDGRVASAALAQSSGHALLDSATMAAVRRAQPFPAIPDGGPATITLTIGLRYDLR